MASNTPSQFRDAIPSHTTAAVVPSLSRAELLNAVAELIKPPQRNATGRSGVGRPVARTGVAVAATNSAAATQPQRTTTVCIPSVRLATTPSPHQKNVTAQTGVALVTAVAATTSLQSLKMYHGTSWEAAQRIMKEGFKPSRGPGQCLGPGVYVARQDKALRFAANVQRHDHETGGLVEVLIRFRNAKYVSHDDDQWQKQGYDACRTDQTSASSNMEWCVASPEQVEVLGIQEISEHQHRLGPHHEAGASVDEDNPLETLAASILINPRDPTRLTWREIQNGWGSCANFFLSHGLRPFDFDHHDEAIGISRAMKSGDDSEESDSDDESEETTVPDRAIFRPNLGGVSRIEINGLSVHVSNDIASQGSGECSFIDRAFATQIGQKYKRCRPNSCRLAAKTDLDVVGSVPGGMLISKVCIDATNYPEDTKSMRLDTVLVVDSLPVPMHLHIPPAHMFPVCISFRSRLQASRFPPRYQSHPWWSSDVVMLPLNF